MIAMYDLEDNLLTVFDSYKECAEYFGTSIKCLHCYISRSKNGKVDRKRDIENKRWCRLFKMED